MAHNKVEEECCCYVCTLKRDINSHKALLSIMLLTFFLFVAIMGEFASAVGVGFQPATATINLLDTETFDLTFYIGKSPGIYTRNMDNKPITYIFEPDDKIGCFVKTIPGDVVIDGDVLLPCDYNDKRQTVTIVFERCEEAGEYVAGMLYVSGYLEEDKQLVMFARGAGRLTLAYGGQLDEALADALLGAAASCAYLHIDDDDVWDTNIIYSSDCSGIVFSFMAAHAIDYKITTPMAVRSTRGGMKITIKQPDYDYDESDDDNEEEEELVVEEVIVSSGGGGGGGGGSMVDNAVDVPEDILFLDSDDDDDDDNNVVVVDDDDVVDNDVVVVPSLSVVSSGVFERMMGGEESEETVVSMDSKEAGVGLSGVLMLLIVGALGAVVALVLKLKGVVLRGLLRKRLTAFFAVVMLLSIFSGSVLADSIAATVTVGFCGDGVCSPEAGETYMTCPVDCPAPSSLIQLGDGLGLMLMGLVPSVLMFVIGIGLAGAIVAVIYSVVVKGRGGGKD